MTATLETPDQTITSQIFEVSRSLTQSSAPRAVRAAIGVVPQRSRLDVQQAKAMNHLICAMVLLQGETAVETQATSLDRDKIAQLLA